MPICGHAPKTTHKAPGDDTEKILDPILSNKNHKIIKIQFSSFHSVLSDSLQPHGLQHARLPCPLPTPELTQTHVHQVSDAIQPSHPLLSPSPPAFNISQHQGHFK